MKNRTAVITGAADGIGRMIASDFLENGFNVAAFDINDTKLNKTVEEFKHLGDIFPVCTNVMEEDSVNSSVQKVIDTFGRIDVLVNNVGGSLAISQSIEYIDLADWDKVINLNLKGTFLCSKAVIPIMKEHNYGRIINISSMAGRGRSIFGGAPYTTAKAGIIGFTRQLSKDLGPYGITINAIAPGTVLSGERIKHYWENKTEEDKKKFFDMNPMGRLGIPKDISRAVLFLSNEEASFITGAVIDINGGMWVG